MSDKRTFWNRDRGLGDLIIFGPIIFLICLLFGSCTSSASGATFGTTSEIFNRSLTESGTFTIPADSPVTYTLNMRMDFALDDVLDKAFFIGSEASTPDLDPITRTETLFIPGDFPDPGKTVTRITTTDFGPLAQFHGQSSPQWGLGFPIREDVTGFFFTFVLGIAGQQPPTSGHQVITVDGVTVVDSNFVGARPRSVGTPTSPVTVQINPDLSLSLRSGTFFLPSRLQDINMTIAVPEPSGFLLALVSLAIVVGHRRGGLLGLHQRASSRSTTH